MGQCHRQVRGLDSPQCCPHLLVESVSSPPFFLGGSCTSLSKGRASLAFSVFQSYIYDVSQEFIPLSIYLGAFAIS